MAAIVVQGLHKHYGSNRAVDGIDLTVEEGEVLALLGPNGAGKTTTVEILEGHRQRTAGDVSVLGYDPATGGREFRERIGIVLQETTLEKELSAREAIRLHAALYPRSRGVDEVIGIVGLDEKADARIKTLSGGQKRRLELALGIVGDPDLIFLDEPTTGFDPSARRRAWGLVNNLRNLGKTILLTTHYMDEAQNLADRVAVIAKGRIVAEGTPDTLAGRDAAHSVITFLLPAGVTLAGLPEMVRASAGPVGNPMKIRTRSATAMLHALTGWAMERGHELAGLSVTQPSLEDIYLQLTGEDSEEAHE